MSRQIVDVKRGEEKPYESVPNYQAVKGLLADLFIWSGEYGADADSSYHRLAQEQLGSLVEAMIELGLLNPDELVDRSEVADLGSFLSYLRKLLLTEPGELVLRKGELIKKRVEGTLFSRPVDAFRDEVDAVPDELSEVDFEVDDTDVAAGLLDQLELIAQVLPSKDFLRQLARSSYENKMMNRGRC